MLFVVEFEGGSGLGRSSACCINQSVYDLQTFSKTHKVAQARLHHAMAFEEPVGIQPRARKCKRFDDVEVGVVGGFLADVVQRDGIVLAAGERSIFSGNHTAASSSIEPGSSDDSSDPSSSDSSRQKRKAKNATKHMSKHEKQHLVKQQQLERAREKGEETGNERHDKREERGTQATVANNEGGDGCKTFSH